MESVNLRTEIGIRLNGRYLEIFCVRCKRIIFSGDALVSRGEMSLAEFIGFVLSPKAHQDPQCVETF